tara:strand:+ start:11347 stop:11730 length:384 start_codon:yes stop_codon:yes gene_type:complete
MFTVPVSDGELIDKYTIVLIKTERIDDTNKKEKAKKESDLLKPYVYKLSSIYKLSELINELKKVNESLWDIEDHIRKKEKCKEFDDEFIQLARNVYITNDKRAEVKNKINIITKSEIVEVKSYEKYQ